MSEYNPKEFLREEIKDLSANLNKMDSWTHARETDSYFGPGWKVNEHTRNMYHFLRPILKNIEESLLQIGIALENLQVETKEEDDPH